MEGGGQEGCIEEEKDPESSEIQLGIGTNPASQIIHLLFVVVELTRESVNFRALENFEASLGELFLVRSVEAQRRKISNPCYVTSAKLSLRSSYSDSLQAV